MSYIFLQEQGEESSADNFSGIPQSALSNLSNTPEKSYCNDNETECCPSSQSGTMSAPLTESPGEEQLMLFAEGSPAKTSVRQEKEPELQESVLDYGQNMQESLMRYGLSLSSRKTPRYCGVAGLTLSSETCPSWGMMQDGACWELGTSARPTKGTGCGYLQATHQYMIPTPTTMPEAPNKNANTNGPKNLLEVAQNNWNPGQPWPTPDASMGKRGTQPNWTRLRKSGHTAQYSLNQAVRNKMWPTPVTHGIGGGKGGWAQLNKACKDKDEVRKMGAGNGGQLNPTWVEWLMGWPIGWTDLKPLETGKYQQWQQQHGIYFHNK